MIDIISAAMAAVALITVSLLGVRNHNRSVTQQLIDQLQEERNTAREEISALNTKIDRFFRDKSASRDYVERLKNHISNGNPPPPPEPPEGYIH